MPSTVAPRPSPTRPSQLRTAALAGVLVWLGASSLAVRAEEGKPADDLRVALYTEPPAGFDQLESQRTYVDVYWAGQKRGQIEATFGPDGLRFTEPAALVALIPNMIGVDIVVAALTGQLAAHPELSCHPRPSPGCNRLEPDVAGIIFEESRFRVHVFIHPVHLSSRGEARRLYLPAPDAGLTFVQRLRGGISTSSDDDEARLDLSGTSILAFDATRAVVEGTVSSRTEARLESARAELDLAGPRLTAGLFRPVGMRFASLRRLVGASLTTPTELLWDPEQAISSPVPVNLPRRSQVTILRGGQILSSRSYEAGLHELDVSDLPQGAYTATLKIRDEFGQEYEEERFIVRTSLIPPAERPFYVAEFGLSFDDPDRQLFARAGAYWRLAKFLALGADVVGREDIVMGELKAFMMLEPLWLSLSGFGSSDRDFGLAATLTAHLGPLSLVVDGARVWKGDQALESGLLPRPESTRVSGTLAAALGPVRLAVAAQYLDSRDAGSGLKITPRISWQVFHSAGFYVGLDAHATWVESALQGQALLTLRFTSPHVLVAGQGGVDAAFIDGLDPSIEPSGKLEVTLNDAEWLDDDLELRAAVDQRGDQTVGRIFASYESALGQLDLVGEKRFTGRGAGRLAAYLAVNGAIDGRGVTFGGVGQRSGVLVVDVAGQSDARFDVLVSDGPEARASAGVRGRITVGGRLALFLPAYRQYHVRLRQVDKDKFLDIDLDTRTVTLFPGTVKTLEWEATRVTVVFGRAVQADGTPVANARIEGTVEYARTDDVGYFQAQVRPFTNLLTIEQSDGRLCRVEIDLRGAKEAYASLGSLQCR